MRVSFSDRAFADLAEMLGWLDERNPQAAALLSARIDAVIEQFGEFPYLGQRRYRAGIRAIPVRGFPYVIFYVVEEGEIRIARFRHGARRVLWTKDEV